MTTADQYSTWVSVDLAAIEGNVGYYLESTGRPVMAVVKANAYGHGAVPVSQAALRAGANWLAVARVGEALELREAGLKAPILILGHTPPERIEAMIEAEVSLTVWEASQIETIAQQADRDGKAARVHLKVDTGMSRLGVPVGQATDLVELIGRHGSLELEGIFTHLARADEGQNETTHAQLDSFQGLVDRLADRSLRPPLVHCANSAAGLGYPGSWFDLIRVGIAMYGLKPSPARALPEAIRPALSWRSSLALIKQLPAGRGISYGHVYTTSSEERIGTAPVGYADGFRRTEGNQALVSGRKVPVVGRVTMDQIMLQLDEVPQAQVGDEVVLLGAQGPASISAEEIAARWGTINYEVTSGIAARVPRLY